MHIRLKYYLYTYTLLILAILPINKVMAVGESPLIEDHEIEEIVAIANTLNPDEIINGIDVDGIVNAEEYRLQELHAFNNKLIAEVRIPLPENFDIDNVRIGLYVSDLIKTGFLITDLSADWLLTKQLNKVYVEYIVKQIYNNTDDLTNSIEKLLPKMGYDYSGGKVKIPAYRTDILHEVDIAEDVAIAYGYDKLIPDIPKVATTGKESQSSKVISKISELLIGLGITETSSYHLIKQRESDLMKLQDKIEVLDSKTEYKVLRPNLLIPTLRNLSENKDRYLIRSRSMASRTKTANKSTSGPYKSTSTSSTKSGPPSIESGIRKATKPSSRKSTKK